MKLIVARLRDANFGDDLNTYIWPRLLPDFFDDDASVVFLGIGSILNHRFDGDYVKVVAGAGHVSEYGRLPDLSGGDWRIYFVRGPPTAAALGLDPGLAIGDPAILIRTLVDPGQRRPEVASFMPHWESMGWGFWDEACAAGGLNLIDPRRPVEEVVSEILRSTVLVTEAMHGAVVADALRVPWVAMRPVDPRHRAKWRDWAEALGLELQPRVLTPSSLAELAPLVTLRAPVIAATRRVMASWPLWPVRFATVRLAADCLRSAAAAPPQLSSDQAIGSATERMLAQVDLLLRHRREGRFRDPPAGRETAPSTPA
jgi:succinoglycan biosynthesis protein ExoV